MAKNLGNILSTITIAVLFLLCLTFVAIRLSGLGTFIVTGGSMEPSIRIGSLVLVQPVSRRRSGSGTSSPSSTTVRRRRTASSRSRRARRV